MFTVAEYFKGSSIPDVVEFFTKAKSNASARFSLVDKALEWPGFETSPLLFTRQPSFFLVKHPGEVCIVFSDSSRLLSFGRWLLFLFNRAFAYDAGMMKSGTVSGVVGVHSCSLHTDDTL